MIGLITADSGRSPKAVAPFGGARRGSAPTRSRSPCRPISRARSISTWRPRRWRPARSTLAAARGEQIPDGLAGRRDGKPTTDPTQLRQGGALLPLGGTEGYKGYGLAAMVEILCGLLTGLGFGVEPTGRHNDGCFMAVFNVEAFRPLARLQDRR